MSVKLKIRIILKPLSRDPAADPWLNNLLIKLCKSAVCIRTFVLQWRYPTHGLPEVLQRVVLRYELMIRDALGGALQAITLCVVPNPQVRLTVVLVHGEKSPTVIRAHVHGDFVRELVVDLNEKQKKFLQLLTRSEKFYLKKMCREKNPTYSFTGLSKRKPAEKIVNRLGGDISRQ